MWCLKQEVGEKRVPDAQQLGMVGNPQSELLSGDLAALWWRAKGLFLNLLVPEWEVPLKAKETEYLFLFIYIQILEYSYENFVEFI